MLKPPPSPKKAKTKDSEDDLHKYAAPGEHIEIPAWKRSGLVMKVESAHYGPEGGRRYLVSHNPSDEKGTWYQLEPHHFQNNDNPNHRKEALEYVHKESARAMEAAAHAAEHHPRGTESDEYASAARRMREMHDATSALQGAKRPSGSSRRDTEKAHNRSTAATLKSYQASGRKRESKADRDLRG